jgi:excisionase family DNA binding protein
LTALLLVDDEARAHLLRALAGYRQDCRRDRVAFPAGLADLIATLAASNGQQRPTFAPIDSDGDDRPMPLLLEPADAARALSLSERTLRRLVRDGELAAVKVGAATRFAPEDLEQFVERKRSHVEREAGAD